MINVFMLFNYPQHNILYDYATQNLKTLLGSCNLLYERTIANIIKAKQVKMPSSIMINRVIQYQNEECIIIHNETLCIKCRNNQMQWFNKHEISSKLSFWVLLGFKLFKLNSDPSNKGWKYIYKVLFHSFLRV